MLNRDPESSGETDATTTALVPVRQRSASILAPTEIVFGFPMPTRRRFLATASTAAVGLMIRPLHVYGEPAGWGSIGKFFKNFAKGILFQFLGSGMPGGFGGIAQNLLGGLFAGHSFGQDWFGNSGPGSIQEQVLNIIGSAERRNVGAAFLKQNGADVSGVYPAGSTVALSFIVNQVLAQTLPLLLGKANIELTEQQIEDLKQRYFLPALQGDFSNIAKDTLRRVLPPSNPYKQFYETETGALVYIGYEPGTIQNENRGQGQATVRVVPPGTRKDAVMKYISQRSNFWTNDEVRKDLVNKAMFYNRINKDVDHAIDWEYPH